jgi:hypothetical protein
MDRATEGQGTVGRRQMSREREGGGEAERDRGMGALDAVQPHQKSSAIAPPASPHRFTAELNCLRSPRYFSRMYPMSTSWREEG